MSSVTSNRYKCIVKRVALIFATDSEGKLLLGKRRDNGRYTVPGGHLNEGEDPYDGAARELKEETGLVALDDIMDLLDERELNGVKFFTFGCGVDGAPNGKHDPDQECGVWSFFDVSKGVPKEVADNLAGPRDKDKNIVTDHFGLEKNQRVPGFPKLGVEDRRETPILNTPREAETKAHQIAWQLRQGYPLDEGEDPQEVKDWTVDQGYGAVNRGLGAVVTTEGLPVNNSFAHSLDNMKHFSPHMQHGSNADRATKLHEDFHQLMRRVHLQHGEEARSNLAHNLWHSIHQGDPRVHNFVSIRNRATVGGPHENEEHLAIMHNYLNDPVERDRYHKSQWHNDDERQKTHTGMKSAMKRLVDISKNHVDADWLKKRFTMREIDSRLNPTPTFAPLPSKAKPTLPDKPAKRAPMPELQKNEEDDEVMRMLLHPNKDERSLALKLGTVNDRHLMRALLDKDPSIQTAALNHPAMTHESLMSLMHQPQAEGMQLLGMKHPLFNREHLRALYDHHAVNRTPAVMDAVTASDHLYPELMERMYKDGNASRKLVARADVPPSIVEDAIAQHFVPGNDPKGPKRYLTMEALKSPHAPHKLVEQAIKQGDEGIQLAAAASPGLSPNVAEDFLKKGHITPGEGAFLRSALVRSPFATERHLDLGLEDGNPLVRAAVFGTESPLLKGKHVDRAIEKGHPHDIVMALKSKAADASHLAKLAKHKDPAVRALSDSYQQKNTIKKFESQLGTFLKKNNLHDADPNSEIVRDMLGYNHSLMSTFDAAKFLIAGNQPSLEQVRKALWQADGDVEQAALLAYGLEVNEGNLRALRSIRDLKEHKKSIAPSIVANSIRPGVEEAQQASEAVERAFRDRFVFPVKLGGKHSEGTLLARDMLHGKVYLLKPGSGPVSPAAGDSEEAASQSRREAGFWHIADTWGLGDYLPRTDLVIIDDKEYACMELLPWKYKTLDKLQKEDPTLPTKLLDPYLKAGAIHKWAVLDFVLGNPDRHANNLMADSTGDTPHADIKLIDHGSAMAGVDFDPANDQDSFVPYYLRAWVHGPFNSLPVDGKLKVMPRVDDHMADELHEWVSNLHAHDLQARLLRYGINPEPAMARLAKLKILMSQEPVDLAINKLWVTT